jgi:thiol-disulfide isomerase/thioredoxin
MAPTLAAYGDQVVLSWLEPRGKEGVWAVRWAEIGGETSGDAWSAPGTIIEATDLFVNWADRPSVVPGTDGILLATWAQKSASGTYSYDVQLARSDDGGSSWKRLGSPHDDGTPTEHGFVSTAVGEDSHQLFWLDGRGTAAEGPMTLRTTQVGEEAAPDSEVDARVCDCCGTDAVWTSGGPVVVYRNRAETEEVRDIWFARRAGTSWVSAPVATDAWGIAGCPVNGPRVDARGDDLVVAWFTAARDVARVQVAFSEAAGFGAPIVVDVARDDVAPLGRVDVLWLDEDEAVVAWIGASGDAAEIRLQRVGREGLVGLPVAVSKTTADRASGFVAMAPAGDGVVVAWPEPGEPSRIRARQYTRFGLEAGADVQGTAAASGPVDATITTLAGEPLSLASLRGAPAFINVWATWCEPCRRELPVFDALREETGIRVLAVSQDDPARRGAVEAALKVAGVELEVALDTQGEVSRVLQAHALPTTVLLDERGEIVWRHVGEVTPDDLREALAGR